MSWQRNKLLTIPAISTLLSLSIASSAFSITYVRQNAPTGGDGSSWSKAFNSIENAIHFSAEGEEVWISQGLYAPEKPLSPKKNMRFYGGFSGNEIYFIQRDPNQLKTIIDGQNSLAHIFYILNPGITIDGVVIQNGNSGNTSLDRGAGILAVNASVFVANSTFKNNQSSFGGAIHASNADLTVSDSSFYNNKALRGEGRGGAIWTHGQTPIIAGSTFVSNVAFKHGGALELNNTDDGLIYDCIFRDNSVIDDSLAGSGGGAVSAQWAQSLYPSINPKITIEQSTFSDNHSAKEGGAVYSNKVQLLVRTSNFSGNTGVYGGAIKFDYDTESTTSIVERCIFTDNTASTSGGAIQSYMQNLIIENSLFTYNSSSIHGGAINFNGGSDPEHGYPPGYEVSVKNSTFYGNTAAVSGGAIFNLGYHDLNIMNSVLWSNEAPEDQFINGARSTNDFFIRNPDIDVISDFINAQSSHIQSVDFSTDPRFSTDSADIFSTDPRFESTDADNFYPRDDSPLIDSANGDYLPEQTSCDINNYPRVDFPGIDNSNIGGEPTYADIGAYEKLFDADTPRCSGSPSSKPIFPSVYHRGPALPGMMILLQ